MCIRDSKRDHTKTVVVGLTGLGLVEMTRKKVRQSLDAMMTRMCPYCGGKGTVMSEEAVASRIRREIRRLLRNSYSEAVLVEVNPGVASYLIGPGGANLKDLEKETGRSIFIRGSESLHIEEMNVKAPVSYTHLEVNTDSVAPAIEAFLDRKQVLFDVERPTGIRTVDLRKFVCKISLKPDTGSGSDSVTLFMRIKHENGRTVRPQWVIGSLSGFGLDINTSEVIVDRLKIYFD